MSVFGNHNWIDSVLRGKIKGKKIYSALGERINVGTTSTGEDIWPGSADAIPMPPDAGEQMSVKSTEAEDSSGGVGVLTVTIEYLDAAGVQGSEVVTLNGTTAVDLTETNVRFVNDMYTATVGANGVAVGDIRVFKTGTPATIYNMIEAGGNKSLVPNRMCPADHTMTVFDWYASEAQGKRQSIRIRSTDMNGVLIPGVFCFKSPVFLSKTPSPMITMPFLMPALSVCKVSSWALTSGGEVSCGYYYVLNEL